MLRFVGIAGILGFGLISACGKTQDDAPADNTAGVGGMAEAGAAGQAGVIDAGAGGIPGVIELGEAGSDASACRVVRRYPSIGAVTEIQRYDWGFSARTSSDDGTPEWLLIENDGTRHSKPVALAHVGFRLWATLLLAPSAEQFSPIALSAGTGGPGYEQPLISRPLAALDGPGQQVGTIFDRGTLRVSSAVSFDGQRGLFVASHNQLFGPRAVLLDASGARIGEEHVYETDGELCDAVPTAHAGAFAFLTRDTAGADVMRIIELDGDGAVLRQVDLPSKTCRRLRAMNGGLAALEPGIGVSAQIYELDAEPRALFTQPFAGSFTEAPDFVDRSSDGIVSMIGQRGDEWHLALVDANGQGSELDAELPRGKRIPGPPGGELYFDVPGSDAIPERHIDVVQCTGPGFSTP